MAALPDTIAGVPAESRWPGAESVGLSRAAAPVGHDDADEAAVQEGLVDNRPVEEGVVGHADSELLAVLVAEVRVLRAEIQTLRRAEATGHLDAAVPPTAPSVVLSHRGEVVGLVGGMLAAFILVAAILVVIVRGG